MVSLNLLLLALQDGEEVRVIFYPPTTSTRDVLGALGLDKQTYHTVVLDGLENCSLRSACPVVI